VANDRAGSNPPETSNLPSLGRRGGGWVFIQIVLFWVLIAAGVRGKGDIEGPLLVLAVALGTILIALGAWLIISGIRHLRNSATPMPKPREDGSLIVDGVYAYVRHPVYLGVIVVAFGWAVAMDSFLALIVAAIYAVFLDLKSRREEVWLRAMYPDYDEYARRTRRLIPYVY
jgi:protein-S-isoprenylcysteine O-methyltransferase Ste14